MNGPASTLPPPQARTRADAWISRAATTTVAALAGVARAISYSHMRQLAATHGQGGWHAHAFPLSVDGVEIVAPLVLLADRRAGRRSGWLPWAALTTETAASLAANIATAQTGAISRVIAGWPALALLIAVKLLSGILEHRDQQVRPPVPVRPAVPVLTGSSRTQPRPLACAADAAGRPARQARYAAVPAAQIAPGRRRTGRAGTITGTGAGPAPGTGIGALLPAARAARDGLRRDGRPLTRDALAARMRASGHRVRNASITALLAALRDESPNPAPAT